jgi:hypothetical protein
MPTGVPIGWLVLGAGSLAAADSPAEPATKQELKPK